MVHHLSCVSKTTCFVPAITGLRQSIIERSDCGIQIRFQMRKPEIGTKTAVFRFARNLLPIVSGLMYHLAGILCALSHFCCLCF